MLEQPIPQLLIVRSTYDIVDLMTQDLFVPILVHENVNAMISVHLLELAAVILETEYPFRQRIYEIPRRSDQSV